jgi:hypothetical protein
VSVFAADLPNKVVFKGPLLPTSTEATLQVSGPAAEALFTAMNKVKADSQGKKNGKGYACWPYANSQSETGVSYVCVFNFSNVTKGVIGF